ncbi:valine--tRNA ligase [Candidatus Marsarchaeota archaeon]|nr:valine--tRNA ligase [Candidatus Marsarchaeota archaeon]MCL5404334.1 valine--tRNA ligase [Candidatus Marsarchaeota archaeon]
MPYNSKDEEKWNDRWKMAELFNFNKDDSKKPLFVIDAPPPNTTGSLHMGQAFWVSYIDAIARYKRMKGHNVLYAQGWDTQGFPTELETEKKYGRNMSEEEFYNKCVEVANANIKVLKEGMRLMGASFDERYEYVTMSEDYRRKVQLSLLISHKKGLLYRAEHPVEWCPHCATSISREETNEQERESELNYIKFKVAGKDAEELLIATTRPELLHACVAVAVNPSDERYNKLVGKKAITPLFGKTVNIIADESVEKEFGTGAEMVCTFGDKQDISMFYKHGLELIAAEDKYGRLLNAGKFTGLKGAEARQAILEELRALNALDHVDKIKQIVKIHDRCNTPIELISDMEWFLKTKENAEKIKEIAHDIKWVPETAAQRLYDWANFIEWDWNISRNRIFGTPIPFWYCNDCGNIIAPDESMLPVNPSREEAPVDACPKCGSKNIVGEKNTCDVWVDSGITPLVVAGWPDNKDMLKSAFPASIRIQGTDIIRTWAFYTIFRTWTVANDKPFETLLTHGMVLGTDGREMHKSYGNGIDPLQLARDYSIDSIRLWVALSGGTTKDKVFSYEEMKYAKSFINKLYNSALFVKNAIGETKIPDEQPHSDFNMFDLWILQRLNAVLEEADMRYGEYDMYSAANALIGFYWHDFCDYYIENVKHRVYSTDKKSEKSKLSAIFTLMHVLRESIKALAPIIPHACEEVNSMFSSDLVMGMEFPKHSKVESPAGYAINGFVFESGIPAHDVISSGNLLNDIISEVRKRKSEAKSALNSQIKIININVPEEYYSVVNYSKEELRRICKAEKIEVKESEKFSIEIAL